MTTTRRLQKPERPRPLKISTVGADHTMEVVLSEMDYVSHCLDSIAADRPVPYKTIVSLCENLKTFGTQLEKIYKDQLDRCYVSLRNGCRDGNLSLPARYRLLEVIELRAMQWLPNENHSAYYKKKLPLVEAEHTIQMEQLTPDPYSPNMNISRTNPMSPSINPTLNLYANQSQMSTYSNLLHQKTAIPPALTLAPGEILKSSGKFAKPARVPGKNLCKDEVVIRNLDSGKVNPGARERLVQITGPTEENLRHASHLIEDTIRRNASPIRNDQNNAFGNMGECSPSPSHTPEDSFQSHFLGANKKLASLCDFEEPVGEYRYTVSHGSDFIRITGSNLQLVKMAKLILDESFRNDEDLNNGTVVTHGLDENMTFPVPLPSDMTSAPTTEYRSSSTDLQSTRDSQSPSVTCTNGDQPESPKVPTLTVIRTPLIAMATKKDIENAETEDFTMNKEAEMRRKLFAKTSEKRSNAQNNDESVLSPAPCKQSSKPCRITYDREFLAICADRPLSQRTPKNWSTIIRTFPIIIKKSCHHLATLIVTMNDLGDNSVNECETYLQDTDLYESSELIENPKRRWTLLRKSSMHEDDNGN